MNAGAIILAGAIVLTGCTTMDQHRKGDWADSAFPTYSDGNSESPRSTRGNISTREVNRYYPGSLVKSFDPATNQRIRALDNLEKTLQKSLPRETLPVRLLYTVAKDSQGNRLYVFPNGDVQSQAQGDLDGLCAEVSQPSWVPPCFCDWKPSGDGGGLNADNAHWHCNDPYE